MAKTSSRSIPAIYPGELLQYRCRNEVWCSYEIRHVYHPRTRNLQRLRPQQPSLRRTPSRVHHPPPLKPSLALPAPRIQNLLPYRNLRPPHNRNVPALCICGRSANTIGEVGEVSMIIRMSSTSSRSRSLTARARTKRRLDIMTEPKLGTLIHFE